jgi:hypothetical protein
LALWKRGANFLLYICIELYYLHTIDTTYTSITDNDNDNDKENDNMYYSFFVIRILKRKRKIINKVYKKKMDAYS